MTQRQRSGCRANAAPTPGKPANSSTTGPSVKKFQKELSQLEEQMQQLEVKRNELHMLMSETQAVSEIADKGKQLKQIDEELPALEARWLELTDLLENTSTQS